MTIKNARANIFLPQFTDKKIFAFVHELIESLVAKINENIDGSFATTIEPYLKKLAEQ